jgi:1-acyl-sn-glycerol-3-phosphate acyltransferase
VRAPFRLAYGLYAVLAGALVVLPAVALALAVCPTSRSAWRFVGRALRLAGALAGMRPKLVVRDGAALPPGPFIAVSNHASYLDVPALIATFGEPLVFTAKREMFDWPLIGRFARRIGAVPVDRRSAAGRLEALRAASEAASAGRPVHVFPEATLSHAPGLLPFRLGAFRLAAEHRLAVVPVAIGGTRRALPAGRLLPRRARIEVRVLPAVEPPPESDGLRARGAFRDRVRRALAAELDEPAPERRIRAMTTGDDLEQLRYPVGRFAFGAAVSPDEVRQAIEDVRALPARLTEAVAGLDDAQLDTPYRPGGWTVRQVVHHVADSHLNSHLRLRLALTEDTPTILAYQEKLWAELPDARTLPIAPSLEILRGLHLRWSTLLDALSAEQLARPFRHPEAGILTVAQLTCLYGWHSRHHVAHVTALREREGW